MPLLVAEAATAVSAGRLLDGARAVSRGLQLQSLGTISAAAVSEHVCSCTRTRVRSAQDELHRPGPSGGDWAEYYLYRHAAAYAANPDCPPTVLGWCCGPAAVVGVAVVLPYCLHGLP